MDYLSANIRHLSTLPGFSEKDAEKATKIGQSAINKIANGRTKEAGYRTVSRLARFYGVSMDDLVGRDLTLAAPARPSQVARPDLRMMAGTVILLSHYLELVGLPQEEIRDPEMLETAYAVVEEFGNPISASNVLDLTKILAKRIRGEVSDGEQQAIRGTG